MCIAVMAPFGFEIALEVLIQRPSTKTKTMSYERSVFINCPFDSEYLPLLRPVLFCVTYLGFEPKIASQRLDSGRPRIERIIGLIQTSMYGIHDISRIKANKKGELYRLNMPFELGLDVGCRIFGGSNFSTKKCLILESERYRYHAALSDLSNSDIAVHNDEPIQILRVVRDWLASEAGLVIDGPAAVWGLFNDFMAQNFDDLKGRGFSDTDIEQLGVSELLACIANWVAARRAG